MTHVARTKRRKRLWRRGKGAIFEYALSCRSLLGSEQDTGGKIEEWTSNIDVLSLWPVFPSLHPLLKRKTVLPGQTVSDKKRRFKGQSSTFLKTSSGQADCEGGEEAEATLV